MGEESVGIRPIEILDLSGGLNSNDLSTQVADNEATDCENVIWYDGAIQKVPGLERYSCQIGGTGSSTSITGFYDFQTRAGGQYLVVATDGDLLNFNTAPGTSIKGSLSFSNYLQTFVVHNDRIVGTNNADAPWTWDGTGNAVTLASLCGSDAPPILAKYLSNFNDRVTMANYVDTSGNSWPTRVAFCDLDNVLSWDLVNNYWEFETDDAQVITGARQLKDKYVVYKTNSIGIVTGYGTQSWVVQRDYVKGIGAVSGYAIKSGYLFIDGTLREVHIFMTTDGPRAFDGVNVYQLPTPSEGQGYKVFKYFDSMNTLRFNYAVGEYYKRRNWYYSFYPKDGVTNNNAGCIVDHNTNSLWPIKGFDANCIGKFFNKTTNENDVLIGTNDGILYRITEDSKEIEDSTELITNGSMEAGDPPTSWTAKGTPATFASDAVTVFQGSASCKIITDALDEGIYQDITTVVGKRYVAWAYAYVTAGDCVIEKEDADGTNNIAGGQALATSIWTRIGVKFTATATTSRIIIRNIAEAASTIYVDDVSVRNADIEAFWESKNYDFGSEYEEKLLREFVPFTRQQGDWDLDFTLTFNKTSTNTTTDSLDLSGGGTLWAGAVWATFTWSGLGEINDDLPDLSQDSFRTLRIKFSNNYGGQPFSLSKIYLAIQSLRIRWFHSGG